MGFFDIIKKKKSEQKDIEVSKNDGIPSVAKKIGEYFSTEPQKEKVLAHEDFDAAGDTYYANVSAHYKVAQRILFIFFVFFLVFSIITNFSEITYDNFYYLLKDFTSAADAGNNSYETLSYESDSRQNFVLYRGGIATVSPSKISIFTATGRRTLNETSQFSSPYAAASDKYVMFFDTAGNTFSIYNSFARVYSETLEHPVKCASLAEDGSFAVVTQASTGYWTTRIYTKNFNHKATIPSSNYIFGIHLDSDEEKLCVLSYEAGNGTGQTVLSVYDLSMMSDKKGNEIELEEKLTYDGEFPIKCGFIDNGYLALITDSRVRILDRGYDVFEESSDFSGGSLTGYYLGDHGAAVSVVDVSSCKVIAYNGEGDELHNGNISYNVLDLSVCDGIIFLQIDQGVVRLNPDNDERQLLNAGNGKMLIYNKSTALVCGESKAEYLVFNS